MPGNDARRRDQCCGMGSARTGEEEESRETVRGEIELVIALLPSNKLDVAGEGRKILGVTSGTPPSRANAEHTRREKDWIWQLAACR